jgi:hypothetical protein
LPLHSDIISYHKFADAVGYPRPQKSNKDENRRIFYKTFLKDLGGNVSGLEM